MKNFMLFSSLLICLCSCADYLPNSSISESERTVVIQVEYYNRVQVETAVMQTLRIVRYNDIEKRNYEVSLLVKARYQELPYDKAMRIKSELERTPGVLDVQFIFDGVPVRDIR